jgi:hypothetical protein
MSKRTVEVISAQIVNAIQGEPLPDLTSQDLAEFVGAVKALLTAEESAEKDAALSAIALVTIGALNSRLRAAAYCALAVGSARLQ